MSIKSALLKLVIKLTPNMLIIWASNLILKGIAELLDFSFDLDSRKIYVKTRLYGENETIEVTLQDFAIFNDGDSYRFILHKANSDRLWLDNLLNHFTGKAWAIPGMPGLNSSLKVVAELFEANSPSIKELE
ncbi:MAG: hypothetical protein RL563_2136 [Pseudomonadota bacterium]